MTPIQYVHNTQNAHNTVHRNNNNNNRVKIKQFSVLRLINCDGLKN